MLFVGIPQGETDGQNSHSSTIFDNLQIPRSAWDDNFLYFLTSS